MDFMIRNNTDRSPRDQDLERRIINYLSKQHFARLRSITVEAIQGLVTIQGLVGSYHERQLCISCCQRVAGVVQVVDHLQVAWHGEPALSSLATAASERFARALVPALS
jgi:osmotically-inducible protein OsmY